MLSPNFKLRLGGSLAACAVLLGLGGLAGACKAKGNGTGTAPVNVPCTEARPTVAGACPDPLHPDRIETTVCAYPGSCADPSAEGTAYFFCPGGTLAAWRCVDATDAGPQDAGPDALDGETSDADADADETATDAEDADEAASDAGDADETATDAPDVTDALDGADAPDADSPPVD